MTQDLDKLKLAIAGYLGKNNFIVFNGLARNDEALPSIRWDTVRDPNFEAFLETASQAGVRMIALYQEEFSDHLADATETLEACEMPREEHRAMERRIADLKVYEGFTCEIEMSFDYEGRVYVFELHTDWYAEYQDLMEEIEEYFAGDDEEEEGPLGGYFSRN